jgi:hypothetical protein
LLCFAVAAVPLLLQTLLSTCQTDADATFLQALCRSTSYSSCMLLQLAAA